VAQPFGDLLWAAVLTGLGPGLLVLATYGHSTRQAQLDRRRQLYGGAFRAAMGWVEGYYRVRRRSADDAELHANHLHDLWEEVAFYEAWLATEAPELGWSYRQLVRQIKQSVSPLITAAWSEPPKPMSEELPQDEQRPDTLPEVVRARDQFLEDIRRHTSIWPWNRRDLYRRYRGHVSLVTNMGPPGGGLARN
jgi:hypothetical protein